MPSAQVGIRRSSQSTYKGNIISGTGPLTLTAIDLAMRACSLLLCRRGFMPPA